jgi:hypothetical protein
MQPATFPKLFTFRESRFHLFQCHAPHQRTVTPPPCLPLYIKDLLKEYGGFWIGLIDWLRGLIGWLLARSVSYGQGSLQGDCR